MDKNLHGENNTELFGDQLFCDENDVVTGRETRLLIGATELSVEQVVESIHRVGGLAIPSHVDRPSFSILSQLGFVPERLPVDALEVSPLYSPAEARDRSGQIEGYPLVCSSDAHRLEDIGRTAFAFTGATPCAAELGRALRGEDGRKVMH
jgi:PHP family Zn ribbon phosphoesterase